MYNFTQKHLQPSHRSELCQNKHVFRKHPSWPDNFFPRWVPYFTIFSPLKWNGGPGWVTIIFNMHWGILGAILSISPKAILVFRTLFVLKSWLSCFCGTATYTSLKHLQIPLQTLTRHIQTTQEAMDTRQWQQTPPKKKLDTPRCCLRMFETACWPFLVSFGASWCLLVSFGILCCLEMSNWCLGGCPGYMVDVYGYHKSLCVSGGLSECSALEG